MFIQYVACVFFIWLAINIISEYMNHSVYKINHGYYNCKNYNVVIIKCRWSCDSTRKYQMHVNVKLKINKNHKNEQKYVKLVLPLVKGVLWK